METRTPSVNAKKEIIKKVLNNFDFEKVQRLMIAENRYWYNEGVPSIDALIELAEYILDLVLNIDSGHYYAGGLEAFYDSRLGVLRLKYIPEFSGSAFIFND